LLGHLAGLVGQLDIDAVIDPVEGMGRRSAAPQRSDGLVALAIDLEGQCDVHGVASLVDERLRVALNPRRLAIQGE